MNNLKKSIILIILLFIYLLVSTLNYVEATSSNISDEIFRLHVIANSNSNEDQNLKYKVRDAIIEYVKSISENITSKNDIIQIVTDNNENIKHIAEQVIQNEGYSYSVNINIGNFSFPTKHYGDISLPSGFYDALRIEIGNVATGHDMNCIVS